MHFYLHLALKLIILKFIIMKLLKANTSKFNWMGEARTSFFTTKKGPDEGSSPETPRCHQTMVDILTWKARPRSGCPSTAIRSL